MNYIKHTSTENWCVNTCLLLVLLLPWCCYVISETQDTYWHVIRIHHKSLLSLDLIRHTEVLFSWLNIDLFTWINTICHTGDIYDRMGFFSYSFITYYPVNRIRTNGKNRNVVMTIIPGFWQSTGELFINHMTFLITRPLSIQQYLRGWGEGRKKEEGRVA